MQKPKLKILLKIYFLLAMFLLLPNFSQAANFPLEIIQPQPNLTTTNRFYKAYPGLVYNVRAAVIGGVYPFKYELTTAPTGMTVKQNTGEIIWPNPISSGSPYDVSLKVTDAENSAQTVSWTITVTTAGFLFVDNVNGHNAASATCDGLSGANSLPAYATGTGTGTINNPFKDISDVYGGACYNAKYASTYAGQFIYFRNGTYTLNNMLVQNPGDVENQNIDFYNNKKPVVWLAYPGENPAIDYQSSRTFLYFDSFGSQNTAYFDGLEFKNMALKGIQIPAAQTPVIWRVKMHELVSENNPAPNSHNQAFIMFKSSLGTQYSNSVIQDSVFYNLNHGCAIKAYNTDKILMEDNIIHDIIDTLGAATSIEGIALKWEVTRATVRHNIIYNVASNPIGGNMHSGDGIVTGGIEIDHNYVQNPNGYAVEINQDQNMGTIYVYQNTLTGKIHINQTASTNGPFYFYNNVAVTSDGNLYSASNNNDPTIIRANNNLSGLPSANLIDIDGNLTNRSFVGTYGWELPAVQVPTATFSFIDFVVLLSNWLKSGTTSDVDLDGMVNVKDLGMMMSTWN